MIIIETQILERNLIWLTLGLEQHPSQQKALYRRITLSELISTITVTTHPI